MFVKDLIEQLQQRDPSHLVVMSRDAEGNGYSPLYKVDGENNAYIPETTWSGEVRLHHLTDELRAQGYAEEDATHDPSAVSAVVLWPTN